MSIDIPYTLSERLITGRVIPFVGAGVSMAVMNKKREPLFPSWRELLNGAADRLQDESKSAYAQLVRGFLSLTPPSYLEAAKQARQGLGPSWFDFLKDQLDFPRDVVLDETFALARLIWQLNSNLIITTNYDRVLRWTCPDPDNLRIWDIQAPVEQARAIRDGVHWPTIWHLHGHIDNSAEMILTPDAYDKLYPVATNASELYAAALGTLRNHFTTHSLLFIGYSMSDEALGIQLRSVSEVFEGAPGPHYALVSSNEQKHAIGSSWAGVQVLTFPNFGEPHVRALQDLVSEVKRSKPASASVSTPLMARGETPHDYNPKNYVFFVPYRSKGNQVIGRQGAIDAIRSQLVEGHRTHIGQVAAFQGLGGLGKTQLAVEYAYQYKHSYPNGVIWLNADQDIDAQLIDLAETGKWIHPESEHKVKLEVALNRLKTISDCLIVFDNLENLTEIENYLPVSHAEPHIIVTSRLEQPQFWAIPLDPLDVSLSKDLLKQEAGRSPVGESEIQAANDIAEALGGLPLALELAGAYLRHRPVVSWCEYRNLLNDNLRAAVPGRLGSFTQHEADLYSTLKISETIFDEEPRLRDIVDILTWSGSAPMGTELLNWLLNTKSLEIAGALGLGEHLRILKQHPSSDSFSIHRLVAKVRREEIRLPARVEWANHVAKRIGDWFEERKDDSVKVLQFEAEIDHLKAWEINSKSLQNEQVSRLIWLQSYVPESRGQYKVAQKLVTLALKDYSKQDKREPTLEANLLHDLGAIEESLGNYETALGHVRNALTIRMETNGEDHLVGRILRRIGSILTHAKTKEKDREALQFILRALDILKKTIGPISKDTAYATATMGLIYARLGNKTMARQAATEIVQIMQDADEHQIEIGWAIHEAGAILSRVGDEQNALANYERATEISLEFYGESHPFTATMFTNVAQYYIGKDTQKALDLIDKALQIRIDIFGEDHHLVGHSLYYKSQALKAIGRISEAVASIERAYRVHQHGLGPTHLDTVLTGISLGLRLQEWGQERRAFQIIDSLYKSLPKSHAEYVSVRNLRSNLLSTQIRKGFRPPHKKKRKR